jgi:hypothetical protein
MQEHLDRARYLLNELPEPVISAVRDLSVLVPWSLVYCDRTPAVRAKQEEILSAHKNQAPSTNRMLAPALSLPPEFVFPCWNSRSPLRALSRDQFFALKETVEQLAAADNRISLFEFTLRYLLLRHLEPSFTPRPNRPAQIYGLRGVQHECSCVLTSVARIGHQDETQARQAFQRSLIVLQEAKTEFTFLPAADCGVACLEKSFAALRKYQSPDKTSPSGCLP